MDIVTIRMILWSMTYSSVVASEKESVETAVMQANEAVSRFDEAWSVGRPLYNDLKGAGPGQEGGQDGPNV